VVACFGKLFLFLLRHGVVDEFLLSVFCLTVKKKYTKENLSLRIAAFLMGGGPFVVLNGDQ